MCGLAGVIRLSTAVRFARRTSKQTLERSGRRGEQRFSPQREHRIGLEHTIFDDRISNDRDRRHGPKHAGYCLWAGADAA
jgi:hypothetical protein